MVFIINSKKNKTKKKKYTPSEQFQSPIDRNGRTNRQPEKLYVSILS
jgi:hypothetical protein